MPKIVCASMNKKTQTPSPSAPASLASPLSVRMSLVVTTRFSSSARPANNTRSILLKDSSQHPLGINVQAINPFNHIRFYLFLRCVLCSSLSLRGTTS